MDDLDRKRLTVLLAIGVWLAQALYVLFPIDLLPDFIPIIGWIDDLTAMVGLAATTWWVARSAKEARLLELFTPQQPQVTGEVYEPIPEDVIRQM